MLNISHYRFGVFEVDFHNLELRKSGLRIGIQDQPLHVLAILLQHPGEIVTREQFRLLLWSEDTYVDFDHGLNSAVKRLRYAIQDDHRCPRFIETIPRHGYRFIAPVTANQITPARSTFEEVSAGKRPRVLPRLWRLCQRLFQSRREPCVDPLAE